MVVYTTNLNLKTNVDSIVDITSELESIVKKSRIRNGLLCAFVPGSTGALTTIEYESGLLSDLKQMLDRVVPKNIDYKHNLRWSDGNGHSHVRAALVGPSITIPIVNGGITLGTWQQIVFLECDVRPRNRNLVVQIVGE